MENGVLGLRSLLHLLMHQHIHLLHYFSPGPVKKGRNQIQSLLWEVLGLL